MVRLSPLTTRGQIGFAAFVSSIVTMVIAYVVVTIRCRQAGRAERRAVVIDREQASSSPADINDIVRRGRTWRRAHFGGLWMRPI